MAKPDGCEGLFVPTKGKTIFGLDLGCGSGRLIRSIWEKSHGSVNTIVGLDISPTALRYARNSIANLSPKPGPERIQLIQADFGGGLWMPFRSSSFDGVTAGLSISYADHWDPDRQAWSNQSYVKLLKDIFVLLKNGGSLVFSSNVPNPNFRRIASESWREIFLTWKLPLAIGVSSIMLYQARWLKDCVKKGRFYYLPVDEITKTLRLVGFKDVKYELTYAEQAWVFRAIK
jgi:ubiquinone/menaquinone biosynthesis C-methylase UbiE